MEYTGPGSWVCLGHRYARVPGIPGPTLPVTGGPNSLHEPLCDQFRQLWLFGLHTRSVPQQIKLRRNQLKCQSGKPESRAHRVQGTRETRIHHGVHFTSLSINRPQTLFPILGVDYGPRWKVPEAYFTYRAIAVLTSTTHSKYSSAELCLARAVDKDGCWGSRGPQQLLKTTAPTGLLKPTGSQNHPRPLPPNAPKTTPEAIHGGFLGEFGEGFRGGCGWFSVCFVMCWDPWVAINWVSHRIHLGVGG